MILSVDKSFHSITAKVWTNTVELCICQLQSCELAADSPMQSFTQTVSKLGEGRCSVVKE